MKKKENKKTTKAGSRTPERNSRAGKPEVGRQKTERRRPKREVSKQLPATSKQQPATINKNSTVFKIAKPSAIGTIFFAEGCISGSQAIRACLMIRIYNN